jgi:hypothetical protein
MCSSKAGGETVPSAVAFKYGTAPPGGECMSQFPSF